MPLVAVAGTFDILHAGHKRLLEAAFSRAEDGKVLVGLTSDEFANSGRDRAVRPYAEREKELEEFLSRFSAPYDIIKIENRFGFAIDGEIDILVLSEATRATGEEINALRREQGRREMEIVEVPHVLAQDSLPISSTRIATGETDENGRMKALRVAVGSKNPVKVSAVRDVFEKAFSGTKIEIIERKVESGVSEQPFEDETERGAINRAESAINGTDAHYGVGVEAGLFLDRLSGKYLDVQYCAIVDRGKGITIGHGAGFSYPDEVMSVVLEGGATIGDAMKMVYGKEDIGKKEGAVGFLSRGLLNRKELTEHAVIAALIPRIDRMA